jgi:LiaF transmembrane domain
MSNLPPERHTGRSSLVLGIILLGLGAVMLAINLGYGLPLGWWQYFPIPLIALGLLGLIAPTRHLDRPGGIWLLATGIYCVIGVFGLFGLGWGGAWPIFVIAAGLGFIFRRYPGPGGEPHADIPPRGDA